MTDLNGTSSGLIQYTFTSIDYGLFTLMLGISAAIGVYFGFFAKGDDTTEEYLHGGKQMKSLPIAISLVASQLSAVSIMTIPAEMYNFGMNYLMNVASMAVIVPMMNYIVLPVFYNNNISNCYEYLELRFNRKTRQFQTLAFMLTLFCMLPVFIFLPAIALSQVTGINIHLINGSVCSICVFYTMFGGIKAVVWTDVLQASIMVVSLVLLGLLGANKVGGLREVMRLAHNGLRLQPNLTFDATTRSTIWNFFISGIVLWSSYVGLNQSCVQRIVSLPTLQHAKRSMLIFGIGFGFIMSFICFTGIVMYARYHNCDPLTAAYVSKSDQLLPFFVQDVLGHLKGMPGIFISCVFSAALSTMSAGMNSLAGVVYFDYIKPNIKHTEQRANLTMKSFIFFTGVYCIVAGFAVEKFSSIFQLIQCIGGITFGSVFGVFLLGMLIPRAHGRAAFLAVLSSVVAMAIIVIGAQGRSQFQPSLPLSVEACSSSLSVTASSNTSLPRNRENPATKKRFHIFDISFNWYITLGALIVFSVAIPLSYILPPEKDKKLNRKLLSPIVQGFVRYELAETEELPDI